MKYKRITSRNEEPFYAFNACKECEQKDGCDKWCAYTVGAYTRLHELEDKIECGELIDRDEYIDRLMVAKDISGMTDKELEFFAKHNARVREQAVKEFADEFKSRYFFMMATYMKNPIYQCTEEELNRLVKEVCGE